MSFKQNAIDVFIENMTRRIPNVSKVDLNIMETAFRAGFNVGTVQNGTDTEKEIALKLLSI